MEPSTFLKCGLCNSNFHKRNLRHQCSMGQTRFVCTSDGIFYPMDDNGVVILVRAWSPTYLKIKALIESTQSNTDYQQNPVDETAEVSSDVSVAPRVRQNRRLKSTWMQQFPVCAGMMNLGNSCFLNSALQALFHIPSFVNWLLFSTDYKFHCKKDSTMCFICTLRQTLQLCHQHSGDVIKPVKIYQQLHQICKEFVPGQQADCHELITYLLASIDSHCSTRHNFVKDQNHCNDDTTPMDEIFRGFIRTKVQCSSCQSISISIEKFRSISLDLDDRTIDSLDDALFHYFREEVIEGNEYMCNSCKSQTTPVKRVYLEKPPNVLCIQLMRFDSTGHKVFKHLRFSEILNLDPYLRNKSVNAIPRLTYSLTSVVAHIGSSIHSGHYITTAKESTGEFYCFNDSQVQQTLLSSVLELESYILIFERVPSESILRSVRNLNNKDNNKVAIIPLKQQNIRQAPKIFMETSKVQDKRNTFEEEESLSITFNGQNTTNVNSDSVITGEDDVGNSRRRQLIIAAALVALCLDLTDLIYKPKEYWERPLFQMRKQCGFYHTSFDLLKTDEAKFINFTRMSITQFTELTNIVAPTIEKNTCLREPISAEERLLITLRYLAIGDNQISLSYLFNISPTAISNIVGEVCETIWRCLSPKVLHEQTEEDWLNISAGFAKHCHFCHCIGAIDGKHVTIQAPANAGSEYYNYKGHHSIVLLAACDANYIFRFVDIGAPGRQSDGGVFTKSNLWKLLESFQANLPRIGKVGNSELPYVFVADSAFPLSDYLLTPFPASWNTSVEKRIYNYRHSFARGRIENAFGILASKWRIYRRPINCSLNTAIKIVKSTVCLHNWLRMSDLQSGKQMYITPTCVDRQSENGTILGTWRKIHDASGNMLPLDRTTRTVFLAGVQTRQAFCDYFNGEGSLSWQHRYV